MGVVANFQWTVYKTDIRFFFPRRFVEGFDGVAGFCDCTFCHQYIYWLQVSSSSLTFSVDFWQLIYKHHRRLFLLLGLYIYKHHRILIPLLGLWLEISVVPWGTKAHWVHPWNFSVDFWKFIYKHYRRFLLMLELEVRVVARGTKAHWFNPWKTFVGCWPFILKIKEYCSFCWGYR